MALNEFPELDRGYRTYRPIFLGLLGRLSRQGYPVAFPDGFELIQEFFLSEWPGLQRRYVSDKGEPGAYLVRAFTYFARARIQRMRRWSDALAVDSSALSTAARLEPIAEARVQRAFAGLSVRDRELLISRISLGEGERELARRFGTSRYETRRQSAEAFARLVVNVSGAAILSQEQLAIARSLWVDGNSTAVTAANLGLTEHQVRERRGQILTTLWRALAHAADARGEGNEMTTDFCGYWQRLLKLAHGTGATVPDLSHIGGHEDEFLDHIAVCPDCSEAPLGDDETCAKVYTLLAVLAGGESVEESGELMQLRALVDGDVEVAVTSVLLPALPEKLQRIGETFNARMLFRAVRAIESLTHNIAKHSRQVDFCLSISSLEAKSGCVATKEALLFEMRTAISQGVTVSEHELQTLLSWVVEAARAHPRLFGGIASAPSTGGKATLTVGTRLLDEDLAARWAHPRESYTAGLAEYPAEFKSHPRRAVAAATHERRHIARSARRPPS